MQLLGGGHKCISAKQQAKFLPFWEKVSKRNWITTGAGDNTMLASQGRARLFEITTVLKKRVCMHACV